MFSLQPHNMLRLYAQGAFPMANSLHGTIEWYCPEVRTILPLDNYNIPTSLQKIIRKQLFEVHYDTNFEAVVQACAAPTQARPSTWISDDLIAAYLRLHSLGYMHTVEVYQNNKLVGGLYGVAIKGAFFGESMFSRVSQASKVAFAHLIQHLVQKNFVLLDVQYQTDHLKMFGTQEIEWQVFEQLLLQAYNKEINFL